MIFSWQALQTADTPIAHFDIKPHNILLAGGVPKITDFGCSWLLPRGQTLRGYRAGTAAYQVRCDIACSPLPPLPLPAAPALKILLCKACDALIPVASRTLLLQAPEMRKRAKTGLPADIFR